MICWWAIRHGKHMNMVVGWFSKVSIKIPPPSIYFLFSYYIFLYIFDTLMKANIHPDEDGLRRYGNIWRKSIKCASSLTRTFYAINCADSSLMWHMLSIITFFIKHAECRHHPTHNHTEMRRERSFLNKKSTFSTHAFHLNFTSRRIIHDRWQLRWFKL